MKSPNYYLHTDGFTVLELLLLVSLIGIIVAISTPFLWGALEKRRLVTERDKVVLTLKDMQQQSKTAQVGKSYGLQFFQSSVLTAPGDTRINLKNGIKLEKFNQPSVYFEKLSGYPKLEKPGASLELVFASSSFYSTVEVNTYGIIDVGPVQKK